MEVSLLTISDLLTTATSKLLEEGIGASFLRHKVIAHNLANVETPGFKRSTVRFEEELKQAVSNAPRLRMTLTHPMHRGNHRGVSSVQPQVVLDNSTSMRHDGNNLDVESEMAAMTANTLYNQAITQQLGSYFDRLRTAINEGRR